jgi:acetyl esterase/lipase
MPSWQNTLVMGYLWLQRFFRRSRGALDVAKERADLEAIGQRFGPTIDLQVTAVDAGGVPAEWLVPPDAAAARVLLYVHGGGWISGSARAYRGLAGHIAHAAGARALSIDYRLAPEHPFPAGLEDALAAYRWLLANEARPEQVVIAGDSAGGNLTLAMLIALRDAGDPLPAAAACLSPATDLALTGETWQSKAKADLALDAGAARKMASSYLDGADPRTPLASPLYADLGGLPPLLIHVGTEEILLSDATRLAEKAEAAGVDVTLDIWPGMWHVWHMAYSLLPESRRAVEQIGAFMRQAYARSEDGS